MKRVMTGIIAMVFVASLFLTQKAPLQAKELKIATVDVETLFNEYYKTKEQDKLLKQEGQKKAGQRQQMVEEIRKMKADAELLSEKARKKRQSEIDRKIKQLQAFDQRIKTELRGKRDEFLKIIFDDIKNAIEKKAKKEGYTIVINDKALLYNSDALDITDEVIVQINKGQKKNK